MVMLQKQSPYWRENGDTEVVSWRESGHVMEVASLMENGFVTNAACSMEGEWSCYGGGQFNGGRMVMLRIMSLEWREKCQRVMSCHV